MTNPGMVGIGMQDYAIEQARAEERERCAKIAEGYLARDGSVKDKLLKAIAADIRKGS